MTRSPADRTHCWIDATAGVSGDMLLGALVDAGAPMEALRGAVEAVAPGTVELTDASVSRGGLRALKVHVRRVAGDPGHRAWRDIRATLGGADLHGRTRVRALRVFGRLAAAEAHVHGVEVEEVHFHEVGAWDSIADIVGVCAALEALGVDSVSVSAVSLGSGRVVTAHGELPVPVPAVLEMSAGWQVESGGAGERATPTGMAIVTALASESSSLPAMTVRSVGIGAGSRDTAGVPNVVRVAIGALTTGRADSSDGYETTRMSLLETNVDDLDPRVWPTVLASLLAAGAADAWLVPISMKKGRPAHTLTVLAHSDRVEALRHLFFELTTTIGMRETEVLRSALGRAVVQVPLEGGEVRVKVAHRNGLVVHATAEFDDAAKLALDRSVPVRQVLDEAVAATQNAGFVPGERLEAAP